MIIFFSGSNDKDGAKEKYSPGTVNLESNWILTRVIIRFAEIKVLPWYLYYKTGSRLFF